MEHVVPTLDRQGLRRFGLTTGGIVVVLFGVLFPWLLERPWPLWPWIILALLGGLAIAVPMALKPIHRFWMKFGVLANRVTSPLILGTVFFAVISPIGLLRRVWGANEMRRPFDKRAASYRIRSSRHPSDHLERPF